MFGKIFFGNRSKNYTPLPNHLYEHNGLKRLFKFVVHTQLLPVILFVTVLAMIGGSSVLFSRLKNKPDTANVSNTKIFQLPTVSPEISQQLPDNSEQGVTPAPTSKSTNTPVNTPTPTPVPPTSTPTPIPHTPNPPTVTISFPSEGQSIELTSGQGFCLVDIPGSGGPIKDKRQNINDQGWSSYATPFTSCYEPKEGANKIQLQYRNTYDEE